MTKEPAMTNDEAGNRVMLFLADAWTNFAQANAGREDMTEPMKLEAVSVFLSAIVTELSSGVMGEAMEALIDARKSVPKGSREGIKPWIDAVIDGSGGLKDFHKYELGGTRATTYQTAAWIIRCLANPQCEGSDGILEAIQAERERKLKG